VTPPGEGRLGHHELCFGCGRTNLFGLLAELEQTAPGMVSGRCFIKQDHQGPEPGTAHPGVIAAALIEAMSLAGAGDLSATEVRIEAAAPVGAFVELHASREAATATVEGRQVASARTLRDSPV